MIEALIRYSLRNRFLVLVMTGLLVGVGVYHLRLLPIDAVPDVTNIQVQVLTSAPALGPLEVEQYITFPVEQAMSGLPQVTEIRSVSRPGLSAVTVVFEDHSDIYWCRQMVSERLQEAREAIPEGYGEIEMGPPSTGLGEIYQFEVMAEPGALNPETGEPYTPMDLRTILDWQIAYQLRSVPGIVEINTFGGHLKTFEVQLDPDKLRSFGIGLAQVFEALERNNSNAGGAYIERGGEALYIRGEGLIQDLEDIENIVVESREDGTPIYIRNLARVAHAAMVRQGAVTRDGRGEAVTGIVMMLMGENSRVVVNRVKEKIREVMKTLPRGVTIDTFYDRTELIQRTIRTAGRNLAEGALLVVAVLLLLLGSIRGGLIVALAIPLSMLIAFILMVQAGVSGNLMSLGAIDFGIIVDGSVLMMENIFRRMGRDAGARRVSAETVIEACREVGRPVFFAVGIIVVVFFPILTLTGVEGKMFQPMALTLIFAISGSLLIALLLMPVLANLLLRPPPRSSRTPTAENPSEGEHEVWVVRWLKAVYAPFLNWFMAHPLPSVLLSVALMGAGAHVASRMGAEFIPKLDEGAIAMQAWRLPSVSLEQSLANTTEIEKVVIQFPEVTTVISKTGRAEIATDPMGVEISDIFIMLEPRETWAAGKTKEDLVAEIDAQLRERIPGTMFSYSQPIELRVSELISGVRSDVAIKLFGPDLDVLVQKAAELVSVVERIPGAADVKAEQVAGLPILRIRVKRQEIARYGINASEILDTVSAIGGKRVGTVFEGQRRFALQVRIDADFRRDIERIRAIRVADHRGRLIPLSSLADIWVEDGPAQISRERIQRRIAVEANVRGRDLASFVAEAKERVNDEVDLPPGYILDWGGQFENLERASKRLMIVVPVTLFLIFVLLYTSFGSLKPAILIFVNVPAAATGGIFLLALRDMPLSISAGVGFIALSGVAVMNGLVLVTYIRELRAQGVAPVDAARQGALDRFRAMIMAPLVAALGFVPMALSTSAGAEVQRPLATVVIGGLVTSTLLTVLVLPSIYRWFAEKPLQAEGR
ncbi:MAG: CusA/CzcA family heavy metal efflux RND transporter [Planctomycetota bacterium]|nr:CusA/CzcA family heavy metal efflux RND transporter [Planctomycetota bacterium]